MDPSLFPYAAPLPHAAPMVTRAQVRMLDSVRMPFNSPDAAPPVFCTFLLPRGKCGQPCGPSGAAIVRCQKHEWCPPTVEEEQLAERLAIARDATVQLRLIEYYRRLMDRLQKQATSVHQKIEKIEARYGAPYDEIYTSLPYHLQPMPMMVDPAALRYLPAPGFDVGRGRPSSVRAVRGGGVSGGAGRGLPRSSLAAGRDAVSSRSSAAAAAAGPIRRRGRQSTREYNPYEIAEAEVAPGESADDLSELQLADDGDDYYGNPYDDADDDEINITN
jgi:hypothetical protein